MTSDFYHLIEDEAQEWARQNQTVEGSVVDDPRDEPQWAMWKRFHSPTKTTDAWAYLDYEGEWGGLYHYRDRRFPAEEYTLPSELSYKIYQTELKLRRAKHDRKHDFAYAAMGLAGALFVLSFLFLLGDSNLADHYAGPVLFTPVALFVGAFVATKLPREPKLPEFRLFLSDFEHEQAVADGNRIRRNQAIAIGVAGAAMAYHRHREHEREEMAEAIRDAMDRD